MKALTSTKQILTNVLVTILLFTCNQRPIDPATTLDEVFIPTGFIQTNDLSADIKTRLEEMRLKNQEDLFYYLKLKDGPAETEKEVIFPQNELKIVTIDAEWNSDGTAKYHGVIVKKIKGDWTNEIFEYYDEKAEPKGGMEALKTLISENLKYPDYAKQEKIEGRVFVQFIIQKDGSLRQVQAVKGIGAGCDEEAARFVYDETEWTPAKIMGKPVESRMILPIMFKLD